MLMIFMALTLHKTQYQSKKIQRKPYSSIGQRATRVRTHRYGGVVWRVINKKNIFFIYNSNAIKCGF
jgi:hypothetical protein